MSHSFWPSLRALALAWCFTLGSDAPAAAHGPRVTVIPWLNLVIVPSGANLADALVAENAGRLIMVAPGDYTIDAPQLVPPDATVWGTGVMRRGGDGLPDGFAGKSAPRITATRAFAGNLFTLRDGARLHGVQIDDPYPGRGGNTVVVESGAPGDDVAAIIDGCDLGGAGPSAAAPSGPIGRVVRVMTRSGDDGSRVDLAIRGSRLRAAGGSSALFVINFGQAGDVALRVEASRVQGQLDANGGVPRPTVVEGALTTITSIGNLYDRPGDPGMAWYLHGGSDAPISNGWPGGRSNTLRMVSRDDTIRGFSIGILGIGAERFRSSSTPSNGNRLELDIDGLDVVTPEDGSDFILIGALSGGDYVCGDDNVLSLKLKNSSGSGVRDNFVVDVLGPTASVGVGNRVVIEGSESAFSASNTGFEGGTPLTPFFLE